MDEQRREALAATESVDFDARAAELGLVVVGTYQLEVFHAERHTDLPVHPTLAKMLAQWKLSGWAEWHGRKPTNEDLIVPTRNMTADNPRGNKRDATEAQRQLVADLELIGLRVRAGKKRNRRGHDLRRTFISLARGDGANDGPLRWVTHGPSVSSITELYSTFT